MKTKQNKKVLWKRWYMIVLYCFVGLMIIGAFLPDNSSEKTIYVCADGTEVYDSSKCSLDTTQTENNGETNSFSDDTWTSLIKSNLLSYGLHKVSAEVIDGRANGGTKTILIGYNSFAEDEIELAGETGYIVGSFLSAADQGWDIDELSVIIGDANDIAIGMWYITKEWKEDYIYGRTTLEETALKALGTMETF